MARLIDADKIIFREIDEIGGEYEPYLGCSKSQIDSLPSVTPQEPRCKDCKWWKDSDGKYRRGCGAESPCPINTHTVCCGEGYCYMFEPQESEEA